MIPVYNNNELKEYMSYNNKYIKKITIKDNGVIKELYNLSFDDIDSLDDFLDGDWSITFQTPLGKLISIISVSLTQNAVVDVDNLSVTFSRGSISVSCSCDREYNGQIEAIFNAPLQSYLTGDVVEDKILVHNIVSINRSNYVTFTNDSSISLKFSSITDLLTYLSHTSWLQ